MINRQTLLSDLQKLLQKLEADLLERSESAEVPDVGQTLRAEYERAKKAERTAQNYEDWRSDAITQAAAAWVLSCVFVRFLEDNRLIDPPKIAGPNERLQQARDEHELYFRAHPTETDREYLLAVFDDLARLPGTRDLFGEHNPIRELPNWLSGDAAGELLRFFQKIDANTGSLIHDFTDPPWDTRFLGDLYQDLSEAARKKYALLQTPEFVEEFILERTLEPALDEFGLLVSGQSEAKTDNRRLTTDNCFKMIDPACGSGHFLLGSFRRILDRWQKQEPGTNVRELVQRTLDSVHGVDVNPFAIAIARFRLLLAAMRACGIARLTDAPAFRLNLVCGDSLLHAPLAAGGKKYTAGQQELDFALASDPADSDECDHAYRSENLPELKRLLRGGQYHAIVANPPYIVPKDRQLNERYRRRFLSCHMKYSLAMPFLERIFRLAVAGGYTGQITANSFMKREFGKKMIESFFPSVDLTHVIDTSGAYIPGHGTPTVILFGRHRPPIANTLRTVMGIRGEPSTPNDPSRGLVWSAIVAQVDQPGSQSDFVSVGNSPRELFHKHPWSIGGGGASELKELLEEGAAHRLESLTESIGFASFTGTDEAFLLEPSVLERLRVSSGIIRPTILGDNVRDWCINDDLEALAPYDGNFDSYAYAADASWGRYLWLFRNTLGSVISFGGKTRLECGDQWWTWYRWVKEKYGTPLSITFAFVATHNHFVLDRGGKVFNRSCPVIKLPREACEDDHLALLGLLNSSVACFFIRASSYDNGSGGEQWERRRQINGTMLEEFPLPVDRPLITARFLDILATLARDFQPASIASRGAPTRTALDTAQSAAQFARSQMIAAQEELDWECYRLYGLIADDLTLHEPPPLKLGQRAFEIVLARKMAAGETQTTWFERHASTPITELPAEWPADYRQLVERRIAMIESDPNIRLIEQPEYKRRWNTEPWDTQLERALREWLLDRLESYFDFDGRMRESGQQSAVGGQPEEKKAESRSLIAESSLVSVAKLADVARQDAEFQQVGELYCDDPAFDVQKLVEELVAAECVPFLPALRYKDSGLRKRAEWEQTWAFQRLEDAIDSRTKLPENDPQYLTEVQARDLKQHQIGDIPVPPKYASADFISSGGVRYWALRGKLDVPKERWISFPHCDGPDGTMMLCWAGYDHLQQARAISAYFVDIQERLGGRDDPRLVPLLAGIIELLPWLKQWHHDIDPEFNQRMDEVYEGFVTEEAKNLGLTIDEIKAWQAPSKKATRRKKAAT
jgi:hypothetical protein